MPDLETKIKDGWAHYIAAHAGDNPVSAGEIQQSVFRRRANAFQSNQAPAKQGDFERLERYIASVSEEKFIRDASYQLYYVTECLIWLWKRLPREILIRDEGRNGADEEVEALLRDLNAGTSIDELNDAQKAELRARRQGERTPADGVELIVKRGEFAPTKIREVAVLGQSHEPPPPPPGWPGE